MVTKLLEVHVEGFEILENSVIQIMGPFLKAQIKGSVSSNMGHESGDKQRLATLKWLAKRRHVQGMLDETDPLTSSHVQGQVFPPPPPPPPDAIYARFESEFVSFPQRIMGDNGFLTVQILSMSKSRLIVR